MHFLSFRKSKLNVGGVDVSQRLILAAGLLKGEGFANENDALIAAEDTKRNIIPGWRIIPSLVGPVEFGSFTRYPRLGNKGTVFWRLDAQRSTQNYVGLCNPGAFAAAKFLSCRRHKLPNEYGINIAASPDVEDIDQLERELVTSLTCFLDAQVFPTWFTLNLSCPNTADDPQHLQLESKARRLCSALVGCLSSRKLDIPLWVKLSPGLTAEQYHALMRVFSEVGVRAVVATNTLPLPHPENSSVNAGAGGAALFENAVTSVRHLHAANRRQNRKVDIIACGGILDGASFREYQALGVKAGQYWSALVYRGPLAAAIIESELARHEHEYEAIRRESLA